MYRFRRYLVFILLGVMCIGPSVRAEEKSNFDRIISCGDKPLLSLKNLPELPSSEPNWEDSVVGSRVANIRVSIQSPLETSWVANYENSYYYEANRIVERIDDYLAREFGIDFYSSSQPIWSKQTTSTDSGALLADVRQNVGKGNADLMIAFAGPLADSQGYSRFGVASLGNPYALVFDHSYTQNCKSAQHEVGHTYGLDHCTSNCVMKQGWDINWSLFDHLCTSHYNQWSGQNERY